MTSTLGEFIVFYLLLFPVFFGLCYVPQLTLCAFCRRFHSRDDMMPLN